MRQPTNSVPPSASAHPCTRTIIQISRFSGQWTMSSTSDDKCHLAKCRIVLRLRHSISLQRRASSPVEHQRSTCSPRHNVPCVFGNKDAAANFGGITGCRRASLRLRSLEHAFTGCGKTRLSIVAPKRASRFGCCFCSYLRQAVAFARIRARLQACHK